MRRYKTHILNPVMLPLVAVAALVTVGSAATPVIASSTQQWGEGADGGGFRNGSPTHIVGGKKAPNSAYPFFATVVYRDAPSVSEGFTCGGAVLAPKRVVTAAHCSGNPDDLAVYVGSDQLDGNGTKIDVDEIQDLPRGEDWNTGFLTKGDLSILELKEPVPNVGNPASILQIASPSEFDTFASAGQAARVIGHGQSVPDGVPENDLREADLEIVSDLDCANDYANTPYGGFQLFADDQVCARASAASPADSSCHGDSGGPLIVNVAAMGAPKWRLIGTVSGGLECSTRAWPNVYAQVNGHQSFLSNPSPTFKPSSLTRPVVKGELRVGETATCDPGTWRNKTDSYAYSWAVSDEEFPGFYQVIPGATEQNLNLSSSFEGKRITCSVTASNDGGQTRVLADSDFGPILAVDQPAPEKPPVQAGDKSPKHDKTAPRAFTAGVKCRKTRVCTVTIATADGENSSGIAQVSARVVTTLPPKRSGGKKRSRSRTQMTAATVRLRPDGDWQIATMRLAKGKSTLEVVVADKAGNRQIKPTRISLPTR